MKRKHSQLSWLIANLLLLSIGMLLAWFILGFEPSPALKMISGWDFIFRQITNSISLSVEYGVVWLSVLSFLQGAGGIFVIVYVVFKIINVARSTYDKGSRFLSIALVIVVAIFLFRDLLYRFNLPLPGYWLFMLGLISSAIFEWRNSMIYK
jgi:hypothetical protein